MLTKAAVVTFEMLIMSGVSLGSVHAGEIEATSRVGNIRCILLPHCLARHRQSQRQDVRESRSSSEPFHGPGPNLARD